MWRVVPVVAIVSISVLTVLALRARSSVGRLVAGVLWMASGVLTMLALSLAGMTSTGGSADNVRREAMWVFPLGLAMLVGGLVLLIWDVNQRTQGTRR